VSPSVPPITIGFCCALAGVDSHAVSAKSDAMQIAPLREETTLLIVHLPLLFDLSPVVVLNSIG
jgi:hypothetical protein